MKTPAVVFILTIFIANPGSAQHCPWDCAGMILLQTPVSKEMMYKMKPVLVDENKKVITDTLYGTGMPTYDRCDFLFYDDFVKYRVEKIAVHHWYQYDTLYHFAEGKYLVHYNFCKYQGSKLYLRFNDPAPGSNIYHYVEITEDRRIHLHNYNRELRGNETTPLKKATKKFVLEMNCENWGLQKKDCR
jgi:hypothetical protein